MSVLQSSLFQYSIIILVLFNLFIFFHNFTRTIPIIPCKPNIVQGTYNHTNFVNEYKPFLRMGLNFSAYTMYEHFIHDKEPDHTSHNINNITYMTEVMRNNSEVLFQIYDANLTDLQPVSGFKNMMSSVRVISTHRMVSCIVPFNKPYVMGSVLCSLIHDNDDFGKNLNCQHNIKYRSIRVAEDKNKRVNFNQWNVLFVKRDPIDRFISAFMDRCVRVGRPCYGCYSNVECYLERLHQALFQLGVGDRKRISYDEYHFAPQTWYCDLPRSWRNVKFIRYSNSPADELWEDLRAVLQREKVPLNKQAKILRGLLEQRTDHPISISPLRDYFKEIIMSSEKNRKLLQLIYNSDYTTWKF